MNSVSLMLCGGLRPGVVSVSEVLETTPHLLPLWYGRSGRRSGSQG